MTKAVILVVDDDPDCAESMGMVMGVHFPDALICVAYAGRAAIDLATADPPHAALLDLEMPGLDGQSLAIRLRDLQPDKPPLLIALSGNILRLAEVSSKGAFDELMSKPADINTVVRLLASRLPDGTSVDEVGILRSDAS